VGQQLRAGVPRRDDLTQVREGDVKVTRVVAPVRTQAVEAIRDEIISGRMSPGQKLVERELCEELQVSRNTIREACRQLEAEGFIEIPAHRGPTVTLITDADARDLYEFREALECFAIGLFVDKADDDTLADLDSAAAEVAAAHDALDVPSMIAAKNHFYEVLYRGAANKVLTSQAKLLNGRLAGLRIKSLSRPGRAAESLSEIREVMAAIDRRNTEAAVALWRQHIRHAAEASMTPTG
jgi:DNA-binding GntR family transcriptional regulator